MAIISSDVKVMKRKLEKILKAHPRLMPLVKTLLRIGGDVVFFDGWASPEMLEVVATYGRSLDIDEVDTQLAKKNDCEMGFCWYNTDTLIVDYEEFQPVYSFALNNHFRTYKFWMEHFILRHVPTGTYHESTNLNNVEKYFVMDLSQDEFVEMGEPNEYFD